MKHLYTIILFAVFVVYSNACSAELLDTNKLLHAKGDFCISDGSSIHIFSPDGKFKSTPVGLSGRTIEGTWKYDSNRIFIKGKWGWVNGMSTINDFREMDIDIGYIKDEMTEAWSMGTKYRIYKAYFVIDRLEKKKG